MAFTEGDGRPPRPQTMAPAILRREPVYSGWLNVYRFALRMPDGEEVERHVEDHGVAIAVLPYDPVRRTAILVSMPRAPVIWDGTPDLLEAIAGRIEGESAAESAIRETIEEAGLQLRTLEPVANIWTMPSISTERVQLYLAPYAAADRVAEGGGAEDENEGITVHEVALRRLGELAAAGDLPDAKTLLLVQALQLRRSDLFA